MSPASVWHSREEKPKNIVKGLTRLGFDIRNGSNHDTATNPKTNNKTTIPRHGLVKKTVVSSICKFLVEQGFTEQEIKDAFRWRR
jgi:predicted RNA binding protein YcfA (HicA-like mRNA interferase family)